MPRHRLSKQQQDCSNRTALIACAILAAQNDKVWAHSMVCVAPYEIDFAEQARCRRILHAPEMSPLVLRRDAIACLVGGRHATNTGTPTNQRMNTHTRTHAHSHGTEQRQARASVRSSMRIQVPKRNSPGSTRAHSDLSLKARKYTRSPLTIPGECYPQR